MQRQAVALDERVARLVGLAEEELRVELDHVDRRARARETMCTSTDDCFCHEHVRQSLSPNSAYAQRRTLLGAGIASKSTLRQLECRRGSPPSSTSFSVSARSPRRSVSSGITSSGGMLPRLTFGPKCFTNHACERLRRRLEDQVADVDRVDDLVDQPGAHLAGRAVDAGGAALAALGDHLPGAGVELLLDPLDPLVRREDDLGVLRADLGEDGEVAREARRSARACARAGSRSCRRRSRRARSRCSVSQRLNSSSLPRA